METLTCRHSRKVAGAYIGLTFVRAPLQQSYRCWLQVVCKTLALRVFGTVGKLEIAETVDSTEHGPSFLRRLLDSDCQMEH